MNSHKAIAFGDKYLLLDLIGIGGMAEVYRSKLVRDKGFEKLIVIKKLLPHVAQDEELVSLFIGEARLAALFQHENIAATYDFGEIDGTYFLAMEYLSGKDLYTFLQRLRSIDKPLGLEITLMIISKICEGMEYAHTLRDLNNRSLNIIHRDITPQNIFITYGGKIKIFDFGVAKAEILDNKTQVGVVKGKLSYMSPEQIVGREIDHRSDIFSIGILLYEMICGKRMYRGDTAALIQKCINADYTDLKDIVPDLPEQLYEIVNRALARKVEDRYQSCAEMQADIDNLMFDIGFRPDAKSLSNFMLEVFAREFVKDRKNTLEVMELAAGAPGLYEAPIDSQGPKAASRTTVVLNPDTKTERKPGLLFLTGRRSLFSGLIIMAVILAFLVPWFLKKSEAPVDPGQGAEPFSMTAHQPEQANLRKTKGPRAAEIDRLQALADQAFAEHRLIGPDGDNALDYFSKILALDPENGSALDGQQKVGDQYVELVQQTLSAKSYSEARKQLAVGMTVFNEHQALHAHGKRLIREKHKAITQLLNKAEEKFLIDHLTASENDCAYKYYNDILELDPENESALEGLEKIGGRYADLGHQAYQELEVEQARHMVSIGLLVVPNHSRLMELKAELDKLSGFRMHSTMAQKALDSGQIVKALQLLEKGLVEYPKNKTLLKLKSQVIWTREEMIAEYSKNARKRLYENKYLVPEKDSAYTYFNAINEIDPGNSIAKEGFEKIANRYAVMADEAFKNFEFKAAKVYVTRGLIVMPKHARLLELKADLEKGKPDAIMKGVMKNLDSLFSN